MDFVALAWSWLRAFGQRPSDRGCAIRIGERPTHAPLGRHGRRSVAVVGGCARTLDWPRGFGRLEVLREARPQVDLTDLVNDVRGGRRLAFRRALGRHTAAHG